jgi:GT2 family glycosyltransferase
MNPVLILTHNNIALTKKAVDSCFNQRLSCSVWVFDNGSKDGTRKWAEDTGILLDAAPFNFGVSAGWNCGLSALFNEHNAKQVLVIGNDTQLPPYVHGELVSYGVPFVTGVAVDTMPGPTPPQRMPLTGNPDFSCFLITRECWEAVGPFNERMVSYCSDCDYHIRAHRLGIPLCKANVPYLHTRSSTLKNASPQEHRLLCAQADADRGTFKAMYGCLPGDADYEKLFLPVETR